jgi:phosphoribosyl 1,2-cyclic phosphodiesterase
MQYKPIEYKDFGYGGKTKTVEPKVEDFNNTGIRFIVPDCEEFVKDDKTVRKYITDVRGFCANPNRVFSLTPNLDWKSDEKNPTIEIKKKNEK